MNKNLLKKGVLASILCLSISSVFASNDHENQDDPCDRMSNIYVNIVNYSNYPITIAEVDNGAPQPGLGWMHAVSYSAVLSTSPLLAGQPPYITPATDVTTSPVLAATQTVPSGQTYAGVFCQSPCVSLSIAGPNAIYYAMGLNPDGNVTDTTGYCTQAAGVNPAVTFKTSGRFDSPPFQNSLINTANATGLRSSAYAGLFGPGSDAGKYNMPSGVGIGTSPGPGPQGLFNGLGAGFFTTDNPNNHTSPGPLYYQNNPSGNYYHWIEAEGSIVFTFVVDDSWFNNVSPTGFNN